jgi:hypothetical protein
MDKEELAQLAMNAINMGKVYPYDEEGPVTSPDWAYTAARGIFADLSDRGSISHELDMVEQDTRSELVELVAEIIRQAKTTETE